MACSGTATLGFSAKSLYTFLTYPCHAHLIFRDLIIIIIFVEEYKLWGSSLHSSLQPFVASSPVNLPKYFPLYICFWHGASYTPTSRRIVLNTNNDVCNMLTCWSLHAHTVCSFYDREKLNRISVGQQFRCIWIGASAMKTRLQKLEYYRYELFNEVSNSADGSWEVNML
jgi:hypothetical protein